MADQKKDDVVKPEPDAPSSERLSHETLLNASRTKFGVPRHVMAGAIALAGRKELTERQAQDAVKAFKKQPLNETAAEKK